MVTKDYYSGQGEVWIAPIKAGVTGKYRFLGNVPELEIATEVDKVEHKESSSGQRLTDHVLTKEKKVSFKATIEELSDDNVALAFQGKKTEIVGGKVTDEEIADVVAGDTVFLSGIGFADLKIKDSNTSAATTLTEGTHYTVYALFGKLILLDLSGLTLPLKATFTKAKTVQIEFMTENVEGYALKFLGLNTAKSDEPVMVELLKTSIDPAKTWALIQDELGSIEIEDDVLAVDGKTVVVTRAAK